MALIQSSKDGKELTGYQLLALGQVATSFFSGIVNKAGQEFLITYSGLNFNVGTGILIDGGLIVENDAIVSNIPLSTGGVAGTKYLVCENNRDTGVSTFKMVSSLLTTNFLENPQGTSHFLLATINHSSSSVTGVKVENNLLNNPDTGWINIPAATGFTSTAKYRKIKNIVYLKGQINKNTGNIAANDAPFTLPLNYRPTEIYNALIAGYTNFYAKLQINTNGTTSVSAPGGAASTYIRLDNIFYIVD